MVTRRTILTGAAAVAATAGSSPAALAQDSSGGAPPDELQAAEFKPLMNFAKAFDVMERLGLDALVLGEGINVYHATGHWPITTRMGYPPGTLAIVRRDSPQPLSLVMSSFTYYFQLADVHQPRDFPIYLYTSPSDQTTAAGDPVAMPVAIFPDRGESPLDPIESRRARHTLQTEKDIGVWPSAKHALAQALDDVRLKKATLATDHPNLPELLSEAAPQATLVDADNALRFTRTVKSALEIALMRQAASANAKAALAAVRTVREGATYRELRSIFLAEAGRRGNRGVFLVIDRVTSEVFDAPFRDGQAFLIDAVSEYLGYHGDYGRTVFVGGPSKPMAHATKAIGIAWNEVRNALKPGMRFSDISALGQKTLKKLGVTYSVPFTPHSVGLFHTDHVGKAGVRAFREDWRLEKDMIVSVDCPLVDAGVGGSAHLEDLTLITANGCESINDVGEQTIIV